MALSSLQTNDQVKNAQNENRSEAKKNQATQTILVYRVGFSSEKQCWMKMNNSKKNKIEKLLSRHACEDEKYV